MKLYYTITALLCVVCSLISFLLARYIFEPDMPIPDKIDFPLTINCPCTGKENHPEIKLRE